jgi:hypothetical protein
MMETSVMLIAACGHEVPFVRDDRSSGYVEEKIAKIRGRPCRDCRIKAAMKPQVDAAMIKSQNKKIKKGQEPKLLPAGATITLVRQDDGVWHGTLKAMDSDVVTVVSAGLMGIVSKLARRWLSLHGAQLKGDVK